ncbi:hypothetical protein CTI12_AA427250 [Artemisia annua]|uniref:Uncharacterized protein n=1 Tax=Artemisia annua TaxID=35608 RepID=A0A2U1M2F9_ARTAN|nr:hypothetical protein CTI12_AA427250 [Artemisia annua]
MNNFLIELLRSRDYLEYDCHEIVNLMDKLPHRHDDHQIVEDGVWPNALDTIVFLWEVVLDDPCSFTPKLFRNLVVPSDIDELNSKVRVLFKDKVIRLKDGDLLRGLGERVEALASKIMRLELSLKKPKSFAVYAELRKKKEGFLRDQLDLIRRKIEDFKWAMECVIDYLDGRVLSFYDVRALNLKGEFDWNQLYSVINRDCRTLKDGLHIFADHTEQSMLQLVR